MIFFSTKEDTEVNVPSYNEQNIDVLWWMPAPDQVCLYFDNIHKYFDIKLMISIIANRAILKADTTKRKLLHNVILLNFIGLQFVMLD